MCYGKGCPLRGSCKRFNAEVVMLYQPYFTETPYDKTTESCGDYYEI